MSGYSGSNMTTWIGTDGRTHAAIRERSYTLCRLDTGKLVHFHDPVTPDDPISTGVSCEECAGKIRAAVGKLLDAMEQVAPDPDLTLTRSGELAVTGVESDTDPGIEFIDAWAGALISVIDSGPIIIPTEAVEEFESIARERGLTIEKVEGL